MTHKTCGTCRFFDTTDPHPAFNGACHLNPPIVTPTSCGGEHALMFTPTDQDSWCGQWEPSEEEMSAAIDKFMSAIFATPEEPKEDSKDD